MEHLKHCSSLVLLSSIQLIVPAKATLAPASLHVRDRSEETYSVVPLLVH